MGFPHLCELPASTVHCSAIHQGHQGTCSGGSSPSLAASVRSLSPYSLVMVYLMPKKKANCSSVKLSAIDGEYGKTCRMGACGYQTIGALFFAAAFLQGLMSSTPL